MGSATNRKGNRHPRDFYETPHAALEALADIIGQLYRGGPILEPGVGHGAVVRWLRRRARPIGPVCGVELPEALSDPKGPDALLLAAQGVHVVGADFLEWAGPPHARFRLIIGNPPYRHAQAFVDRSLELLSAGGAVVFLLRLGFLGSQRRRAWWRSVPLSRVRVLSKRPSFTGGATDATEYAWFIFEPGHNGPARLDVF